ncbi:type I glyceraldehyde-3-phosphate dehydrogenase [Sediminibacterium ginsengisoli]|uniref:Glyceraldehyde 3-phosphate dehydrogenase n=1 Tax=Sediminibacterium ginsengisoli TaxID=413434 RepID=A0A1T4P5A3_9BACT|nr:glyceraldehyde 3-phosphate dehydrogenase NAD-binding domain-containing protein [Sediminibacterium ginsengisoli]SJZ86612.1 glyceraldehyde 3-phosphate dehydrogenase [Sediminibacterium ginsengisoli]
MRIAINGMGRIGRLLLRRLVKIEGLEVVAVNDIMTPAQLVYLQKYDSVYGAAEDEVALENGQLCIAGKTVQILQQPDPAKLPWKELDIDLVLECTGLFMDSAGAGTHLQAGARKVLLSTTGAPDIPLCIYGFNQHQVSTGSLIVSPGGCMTNCSTHLIYLMQSIGIEAVHLNVVHSYTSRQHLVDGPHKDMRRGRAAAESVIPVPVDLAESLERLFPVLKGRIHTVTTRVPVANGALADFTFQMKADTSVQEINRIFKEAAASEYKGIIAYTEDPLVSNDVRGNTHSAVVEGSLTAVTGRMVKLMAFFDNEYGYTSRVVDWVKLLKEQQAS